MDARPGSAGPLTESARVLHVVRHGAAGDGSWPLRASASLSAEGQRQAHAAAARLAAHLAQPPRIYASDLPRCRETAAAIAQSTRGETVFEPRLRELEFGWEGESSEQILARIGEERLSAFLRDPAANPLPGSEPFAAFWSRVAEALQGCLPLTRDGPVVIVAHDGVNRAIELIASGRAPSDWPHATPWRHGEVRQVAWRGLP